MKKHALVLPLIVAAFLVSGCATTPYDGSPPKVDQGRIDAVTASATAWLASDQGKEMFPTGVFAGPVAVFDINRTFDHWILPVKNDDGLYIGFFIDKSDSFTTPNFGVTKYPDPRHDLFSIAKDDAYNAILADSVYSADQIREPYVCTIEGMGYNWVAEVVINGKLITKKTVPVSILVPSDADKKGPGL
jgi:hypothetical protein